MRHDMVDYLGLVQLDEDTLLGLVILLLTQLVCSQVALLMDHLHWIFSINLNIGGWETLLQLIIVLIENNGRLSIISRG